MNTNPDSLARGATPARPGTLHARSVTGSLKRAPQPGLTICLGRGERPLHNLLKGLVESTTLVPPDLTLMDGDLTHGGGADSGGTDGGGPETCPETGADSGAGGAPRGLIR